MAVTGPTPPPTFASRIITGYEGVFKFAGKAVGHISNIPVVGYATRIPVAGLRSFVEGHDEVRERYFAKQVASGKMTPSEAAAKTFKQDELENLRQQANAGA